MPHAPAPSDDAAGVLVETAQALPDDRVAEKRALLRRALDLDPRRVDALLALGEIRLDDEDYAEAIDLARRCLDVDKGNDDCADVRRMALGRSGRQDPEDTELAYAQNRHDFGRVQGLAQLRISQGRLVEARALIEEMRALAPESSLVPTMEGDVALSSGDPAGARQAFEAACHLGQEHACIEAERLRSPR
jgi:tetratricopeptide (TPR) repeat protein